MTPSAVSARRALSAAALLAASGLALSGCKFSATYAGSPSPQHSSSAAASGSSSPADTPSAPASQSAAATPSGTGTSGAAQAGQSLITSYLPVHAGNTWVYQTHLASRRGTTVTKMTRVLRMVHGRRVTMAVKNSVTRTGLAGKVTRLQYFFRADGRMSVPLRSLGAGTITVRSGSVVWPSPATLAAGKSRATTVVYTAEIGGRVTTIRAIATVRESGAQTISVPAGTYRAQVVDETLREKLKGIPVLMVLRTWIANGVGPVRSELVTTSGSVASPGAVEELQSFTKG